MKRTNLFKTFFCIIFSLLLAFCCFAGCTEYKPPENTGDPDAPVLPSDPDDPDAPVEPEDTDKFTVQLIIKPQSNRPWINFTKAYYNSANSNVKSPVQWDSLQVQWLNKRTGERHYSYLDDEGKAECTGLDGDYQVTLVFLPTGFTYEPNTQTADNFDKNIDVPLYKVQSIGKEYQYQYEYYYYKLGSTGAYSVTLNSSADRPLFQYTPPEQGTYSFRTLVDVSADLVNPKLNMRTGNSAYISMIPENQLPSDQRQDGGGAEGTYTKNVYWQYSIAASYIGNCFYFELYSETRDEAKGYPITVYFLIERDGDYSDPMDDITEVTVTEDFSKTPETPEGTFTYTYNRPGVSNSKLDQTAVMLNTTVGRKGKKLVMLNTDEGRNGREVLMLNTEEGRGDKNVNMGDNATLDDGKYYKFEYDSVTDVYTLTDEAVKNTEANIDDITDSVVIGANVTYNDGEYYYFTYDDENGMYNLTEKVTGKIAAGGLALGGQASYNDGYYYYYEYDEDKSIYTLTDRVYAKLNAANAVMDFSDSEHVRVNNVEGYNYTKFLADYQDHCNAQGCYPVNEELMLFLQRYAVSQRLFNDGNGYAEMLGLNSDEYSMWMFSCGYYA